MYNKEIVPQTLANVEVNEMAGIGFCHKLSHNMEAIGIQSLAANHRDAHLAVWYDTDFLCTSSWRTFVRKDMCCQTAQYTC